MFYYVLMFLLDNMWGHYGQYRDIVSPERASDKSDESHYVLHDVTTFFTLLVGIYFPSVTGILNLYNFLFSAERWIFAVLVNFSMIKMNVGFSSSKMTKITILLHYY